jgi:hypothetical protein
MRYLILLFSLTAGQFVVASPIVPPLEAELVNESSSQIVMGHQIVLGSLRKINHEPEPEDSKFVRGRKSTWIYYVPQMQHTQNVSDYLKVQFEQLGTVLFNCAGRTCGSSSYWANQLLRKALLYGPEQYQHYYAIELFDGSGYLVVYIGQRATRKIYLYVETVDTRIEAPIIEQSATKSP